MGAERKRYRLYRFDVVGYVLSHYPVATGSGGFEKTLFIGQNYFETVNF